MKSVATANSTAGGYVETPSQPAIVLSPSRQSGQHEQHDPGGEPEQGVALLEPAPADELEHDEDQQDRRDRADDRDAERRHLRAASRRGYRRRLATSSASMTLTM